MSTTLGARSDIAPTYGGVGNYNASAGHNLHVFDASVHAGQIAIGCHELQVWDATCEYYTYTKSHSCDNPKVHNIFVGASQSLEV